MTENGTPEPAIETIVLTNTLPSGGQINVTLATPPADWWKQIRPGGVAVLPVLAVQEVVVRSRKPVAPEPAAAVAAPKQRRKR